MKKLIYILLLMLLVGCVKEPPKSDLRAPAYPLITIDPYISSWSSADNLYDDAVRHWTTSETPLTGVLRVDGENYRFMGAETEDRIMVAPMGLFEAWEGRYTTTKPAKNWMSPDFNDRSWSRGVAPFGNHPRNITRTKDWKLGNIWVRRVVKLEPEEIKNNKYYVYCSYDYGGTIYINGVKLANRLGYCQTDYRWVEIPCEAMQLAKDGEIVMAMNVKSRYEDSAMLDMGLYRAVPRTNAPFEQTAVQLSADVQATRTIYEFRCGGVDLKLTFMAPMLLEDPELVARPVNYISYEISSNDDKHHDVQIYFEADENWARHNSEQRCISESLSDGRFDYLRCGTEEQMILGRAGDNARIDWGYFYIATPRGEYNVAVGEQRELRDNFITDGSVSAGNGNTMVASRDFEVVKGGVADGYLMLGYDDIYSIQYFGENLRPYWNRKGDSTIQQQFAIAADEYEALVKRCTKFDAELMREATNVGGKEYAELCALAYRQTIAAHKLVETPQGEMAWFSKENFSNGCLGTVDVTYPSIPLFLIYNPDFAEAMLTFIFDYSESGKWNYPYPTHDIGRYPWANGTVYTRHMPVEEAGNMLVMTSALCKVRESVDYALKHWDVMKVWADYLVENGMNTKDELCTDDFAGRMSYNANLSVKAIMGVAAFGDMARMANKSEEARYYTTKAREMAADWTRIAAEEGYYRLTLQQDGTFTTSKGATFDCRTSWSQKYNMVWDKVLGYDIFDDSVAETEIAYYLTKQNMYGLPLDSRDTYTKSDWIIWTATMADDKGDFEAFVKPMYRFMNETTDRIPMTDFYYTDKPEHRAFRARSVVGGYFMKMLDERLND